MKLTRGIMATAIFSSAFIFCSCEDEKKEDLTQSVNKSGAVETSVTVEHLDGLNDVLVTKHSIWNKGATAATFEHRDTIPALGLANTEVKDESGKNKNIEAKKEYEIFITVK